MQRLQRLKTRIHSALYSSLRYNTGLKMKWVAASGWHQTKSRNSTNCMAEKSNAERYSTHFSAFDLSALSGFFFSRVSLVSKPL
jgi:hypothetical protein